MEMPGARLLDEAAHLVSELSWIKLFVGPSAASPMALAAPVSTKRHCRCPPFAQVQAIDVARLWMRRRRNPWIKH